MTEYCRDGGVCHHNCNGTASDGRIAITRSGYCFREDCCEPLTLSNLNWNWTPKTRLLRRYKGHVIKLFHNDALHQSMLKGWTVECRIDGEYIGTSFRSFAAALRTAKDSIDHALEQAPLTAAAKRAHSFVRLQAAIRRHERKSK